MNYIRDITEHHTMNKVILTQSQARKIILQAAGLSRHAQFGRGKNAVYKLINHLGFVQIDTNYVVERAHHHVLAVRIPGYKAEWLYQLLAEGRVCESWTFASGYIPMHDFRFSLPIKESFVARRKSLSQMEINVMSKVLDRISREGPLMARDFENDRTIKSSGWWDWRPSKLALERMYLDGRLMVNRRNDFQKIFDLTENILPHNVDKSMPSADEFARHVIIRSLNSLGIAYLKDIAFGARYVKKNTVKDELQKMVEEGLVTQIEIKGLKSAQLYALPEQIKKTVNSSLSDVFILSPFDVLNVFRHRLKDFFNFDYQVECFVPAAKRKYGYFSLPILMGDTFVARMDSKADRKLRILTINNLHFEKVKLTKANVGAISDAIKSFAEFNQCDRIVIKKANEKLVLKHLQKELTRS
ncbi:MAG TPA: crosslink repair DNA glycosylase YcaQ family protein [Cyclobacteriaceae bacterium]